MQIKTKILFLLFLPLFLQSQTRQMEYIEVYEVNNSKPIIRTIEEDYKICQEKLQKSFVKVNGVESLAIGENYAIAYNEPSSYQVYNPFYNFFIIHKSGGFDVDLLHEDCNDTKRVASISKDKISYGELISENEEIAKVNFALLPKSFIVSTCCQVLGIASKQNEFLPLAKLEELTKRKTPYDGYIGASFYQKKGKIYVKDVDFNLKEIYFCPEDEIVSINGVKIDSIQTLKKIVLPSAHGEILRVEIRRAGELKTINIPTKQQPFYEINSAQYLEKLGARFSNDLTITSIFKDSFASKNRLFAGDKLLEINFQKVRNIDEAKKIFLYGKDKEFHLLFTRQDFQFFIKFNRNDIKGGLIALEFCPAI